MATFISMPSGSVKAVIRKKGVHRTKTFRTKAAARQWAVRIEAELIDSLEAHNCAPIKVGELAEKYLDQYSGRVQNRESEIQWWIEQLGAGRKVLDVTSLEVGRALDAFSEGRTVSTVENRRAALAAMVRYGQTDRAINLPGSFEAHRVKLNSKLCAESTKVDWLISRKELLLIIEAADQSRWPALGLFVRLATTSGARRGELLQLRWRDIDIDARVFTVGQTKNGQRGVVVPFASALSIVACPRDQQGAPDQLVFACPTQPDKPMRSHRHWHAALEQAGLADRGYRIHDLRHFAGSLVANSGAGPYAVRSVLRHSSIQTSDRYTRAGVDGKREVLDAAFEGIDDAA